MQFDETKTYKNLARSFAGESQAGMRYQLAAKIAEQQGYAELSNTIKTLAKNETEHARRFFEELNKRGSGLENIDLEAGYPFHGGTLEECLKNAAKDEHEEHSRIYPAFAKDAEEEGFLDIAALFRLVTKVEKHHEQIFNYLYEAFKKGVLYKNESPMLYICSECGHMHTATSAWDICPLCGASQGFVELHLPYNQAGPNSTEFSFKVKENGEGLSV